MSQNDLSEQLNKTSGEMRFLMIQQEYEARFTKVYPSVNSAKVMIESILDEVNHQPTGRFSPVELFQTIADDELKTALKGELSRRYRSLFGKNSQ